MQERLKCCCCEACMNAPRYVRPPKSGGHYGSWLSLADPMGLKQIRESMTAGRGHGRLAKRQRRNDRLRTKRAAAREEKTRRRRAVKVDPTPSCLQ